MVRYWYWKSLKSWCGIVCNKGVTVVWGVVYYSCRLCYVIYYSGMECYVILYNGMVSYLIYNSVMCDMLYIIAVSHIL